MRKYLLKGIAVLAMGCVMTACSHDFTYEQQEQQASLDNAQQTLGFYIPENQDWIMTSSATATFNVKGLNEDATLYVFSNNPQSDGYGTVLASAPMTGTTTTISDFRIPSHVKSLFVGLKQSNGNMIYKYVDVEDGQLAANYDFSTVAQARTRANAMVDGDPFTFENTSGYYKTAIPEGAKDINTTGDYDCMQAGVLFATSDFRNGLNLWEGPAVDIYVNGNVKLSTNTYIHSANFYILPGATLTMEKQANYECAIYVSQGATLNYNVSKLEANTYWDNGQNKNKDDVKSCIYNHGTVNFSSNFEANQYVTIYNEGTMNGQDITSKPGDGHPSYFYNFGDLTLTGNMVLNSCANFYNEGNVSVAGQTEATQKDIWWINNGHYTTGTLVMHPWNETFYNYCQLLVEGNTHFYNGAFHLMDNSYLETETLDVDNFTIYMSNNSGFNCKGNNSWGDKGGQGDGTYNGFMCSGNNSYVRLGGTSVIAGHLRALETRGNVTIAINSIDDKGAGNSGVQPTVQLNEGTTRVTFSELNPTYNSTDCGATWTENPAIDIPTTENQTWTYAFEDNKTRCDFDMNDVVIQVRQSEADETKLIVTLVAAGCEYDNYVWLGDELIKWPNGAEVHDAFGASHGVLVNTGRDRGVDLNPVSTTINMPSGFNFQNAEFKIRPYKINSDRTNEDNARDGYIEIVKEGQTDGLAKAPLGIAIPAKWLWPLERINVTNAYEGFTEWGSQADLTLRAEEGGWYQSPSSGLVYGE